MVTGGMTIIEQNTMESIQSINQKMPEVTLRDMFAMNAINGLLSFKITLSEEDLARMSYKIADAMMKARKNK